MPRSQMTLHGLEEEEEEEEGNEEEKQTVVFLPKSSLSTSHGHVTASAYVLGVPLIFTCTSEMCISNLISPHVCPRECLSVFTFPDTVASLTMGRMGWQPVTN